MQILIYLFLFVSVVFRNNTIYLLHENFSPSADSRRAVVSYWRKYVHEVLVNRLGGLACPGKVWVG